ncbi:MAG: hypothetical protein JNG84_09925 [Archangium sp.]|nr:hypothetical protein [Archangium sp.]
MSSDQGAPSPVVPQFDKAEFSAETPGAIAETACVNCNQPFPGAYFTVNGRPICPRCKAGLETAFAGGSGVARLVKAPLLGLVFGLGGTVVWYLVEHVAKLQIGLIAILIGYLVGRGVATGSENRGGVVYQVIAGALTYLCICLAWAPEVVEALANSPDGGTPLPLLVRIPIGVVMSLGVPFMGQISAITLLIIAFGIWEAIRRNKKVVLQFEGPFQLASPAAPHVGA